MMRAVMKRARAARAMATVIRVVGDMEGKCDGGNSNGNGNGNWGNGNGNGMGKGNGDGNEGCG